MYSMYHNIMHTMQCHMLRGKWVHVAVVAAAPPKKQVTLFVDGALKGNVILTQW